MKKEFPLIFFYCFFVLFSNAEVKYRIANVKTYVVKIHPEEYSGWPANNGLWSWDGGNEMLVGFTTGFYDKEGGYHNISEQRISQLARSRNGGKKWKSFCPENYVVKDAIAKELQEPIDFKHPNLAIKMCGVGYHAHELKDSPVFYFSYDRGEHWEGPYSFEGLLDGAPLDKFKDITMRTDYHIISSKECIFFGSATQKAFDDKVFAFKTTDGGLTFEFVSWIVSPKDPYRGVMPQTVQIHQDDYISVIRRRAKPDDSSQKKCWLDAYRSGNGGKNWSFLSKVAETGDANTNGNPPALTVLKDGRFLVVYGNRSTKQLVCKISLDEGKSWGNEIIIRDDFVSYQSGSSDFGYPRVLQREDGKIVVVYYFADLKHGREQHIDCSVFSLKKLVMDD